MNDLFEPIERRARAVLALPEAATVIAASNDTVEAYLKAVAPKPILAFLSAVQDRVTALKKTIDQERQCVHDASDVLRKAVGSRRWMCDSRGVFGFDDPTFQGEFGDAIREIDAALDPLVELSRNLKDCPPGPMLITQVKDLRSALAAARDELEEQWTRTTDGHNGARLRAVINNINTLLDRKP